MELVRCLLTVCQMAPSDPSDTPRGHCPLLNKTICSWREKGSLSFFVVQRFHSFLFRHRFELVTDHQPLLALLHEHRPTSTQASACIRHWSLLLSAYEYTITFRKTQAHQNADALSRLPLPQTQIESKTPPELVLVMDHLDESPVTARHIQWSLFRQRGV